MIFDLEKEIDKRQVRLQRPHRCVVYRLSCKHKKDLKEIQRLAQLEDEQRFHFEDYLTLSLYECSNKHFVYYVAFDESTQQICGVCQTEPQKQSLSINYLSSRSSTDSSFRGVGTLLLDTIITDCHRDKKINFVYLWSASNAIDFYEKYGLARLGDSNLYGFAVKPPLISLMNLNKEIRAHRLEDFEHSVRELLPYLTDPFIWISFLTATVTNQSDEMFIFLATSHKKLFKEYLQATVRRLSTSPHYLELLLATLYKRVPRSLRIKVAILTNNPSVLTKLTKKEQTEAIDLSLSVGSLDSFRFILNSISNATHWFEQQKKDYQHGLLVSLASYPELNRLFFRFKDYVSLEPKHLKRILIAALERKNEDIIQYAKDHPRFLHILVNRNFMHIAIQFHLDPLILKGLQSDWWKKLYPNAVTSYICENLAEGSTLILDYLLEKGIPVKTERCMLNSAIQGNIKKLVKSLVHQGIPFDAYSLDAAIQADNLPLVEDILRKGVRGTHQTWTLALEKNNPQLNKLLMQYPLKVTISHVAIALQNKNVHLADWFKDYLSL